MSGPDSGSDADFTVLAAATPAATRQRLLVRNLLAFAAAILLGLVLASGVQHLLRTPNASPHLNIAIILAGTQLNDPEQLTLPSGSVFALNLRSTHSGMAEVYAINPKGDTVPVWSTRLQADQDQRTPELRLQGRRGQETLRIVFQPDANTAGQHPATLVRQISILHM